MSDIVFVSVEEKVAVQYFNKLCSIGGEAFAVWVTLLAVVRHGQELAYFAFSIFALRALHQGRVYKQMIRQSQPGSAPDAGDVLMHSWLFFAAMILIALLAVGWLKAEMFVEMAAPLQHPNHHLDSQNPIYVTLGRQIAIYG